VAVEGVGRLARRVGEALRGTGEALRRAGPGQDAERALVRAIHVRAAERAVDADRRHPQLDRRNPVAHRRHPVGVELRPGGLWLGLVVIDDRLLVVVEAARRADARDSDLPVHLAEFAVAGAEADCVGCSIQPAPAHGGR
jgi:hypothetical protein